MIARLLAALGGVLLTAAAAAQGDPPQDPRCPQGDLAFERGPGSVCIGRLTGRYAFSVIYPAAAAAIPALDALIRAEAGPAEAQLRDDANALWRGREAEDGTPPTLSYEQGWLVDARRPELVAASATTASYTGGAHGGIDYRVVLLDPRAGRRLALADLFADPRGMAAVQRAFCQALTNEVRARRDDNRATVECPDASAQPITLLCGEHGRIDALRALLEPYLIGSWAEGPYEFDFAVTADMLGALSPAYRGAFALRRQGRSRPPRRRC